MVAQEPEEAMQNGSEPEEAMQNGSDTEESIHVVVFPDILQGHINPMLELSLRLIPLGFNVSFMLPPDKVCSPGLFTEAGIRLISIPETDKMMLLNAPELQESVESILREVQPPVKCIIADFFIDWAQDLANNLGIPRAALCPSNAASEVMLYHMSELLTRGYIPADPKDDKSMITFLPGMEPFPRSLLPMAFREGRDMQMIHTFSVVMRRSSEAACILVNSVEELEQEIVDARRLESPPYFPVGPLILHRAALNSSKEQLKRDELRCLDWLDLQAPRSVLYIAFGSLASLSADKVERISKAVKQSGHRFLWAIRRNFTADAPGEFYDKLRESFVETGQGLFVEWAPQVLVLGHSSVGGFFTHCGWNSTMESVSSGVPMLCWPLDAEQNYNAYVIEKKWRIGKRVGEGNNDVEEKEIEKAIRDVMAGDGAEKMRARVDALKEVVVGGASSLKNLCNFKKALQSFS